MPHDKSDGGFASMGIETVACIAANAFSMNIQMNKRAGKGINREIEI